MAGWRNVKEELIQAVENNFTLLSVKCELSGTDHFDKEDKAETGILRQPKHVFGSMGRQARDSRAAKSVARGSQSGAESWTWILVSRVAFSS